MCNEMKLLQSVRNIDANMHFNIAINSTVRLHYVVAAVKIISQLRFDTKRRGFEHSTLDRE